MFPLFYCAMNPAKTHFGIQMYSLIEPGVVFLKQCYTMMNYEVAITIGESISLPVEISYPIYLIPGIAVLIIVSLLTKQHNQRDVDEFYARLDTPLGEEHKLKEMGYS